jgi:hypothetical protein
VISYDALGERLKLLTTTAANIEAMWEQVKDLPDDSEENAKKKLDVMQAHFVMMGRRAEVMVWREWIERWPHIELAAQLPTERNTVRHDAVPDTKTEAQGWRERERTHRGNADTLSAALPNLR